MRVAASTADRYGAEVVVPGVDDQRRDRELLEREPVRCEVRDEPVEDRAVAPGLVREGQLRRLAIDSASRAESS
jgi:hypothetical protein